LQHFAEDGNARRAGPRGKTPNPIEAILARAWRASRSGRLGNRLAARSRQRAPGRLLLENGRKGAARFGRNDAMIKTFALAALALAVVGAPTLAFADDACMTQAMDKKLAGAAKTSFMTKCERTSCEGQAKDKNLHGAAMTSFVKKCTKDAMAMPM
jgi:hypothetical protein